MEKINEHFNSFETILAKFNFLFDYSGTLAPVMQLIKEYLHDIVRIKDLDISDEEKCWRFYHKISQLEPIAQSGQSVNPLGINWEIRDLCSKIKDERRTREFVENQRRQIRQIPYNNNYVNEVNDDDRDYEIARHNYFYRHEQYEDEGYETDEGEFMEIEDFDFDSVNDI